MIRFPRIKDVPKEQITTKVFAKGIARAFMRIKSSFCYFVFQQAFGEIHSWEDVEEVCNRILKEAK